MGCVSTGCFAIDLGLSLRPELVATALKGTPAKLAIRHSMLLKKKAPRGGPVWQ
jgi:hypothetical protein